MTKAPANLELGDLQALFTIDTRARRGAAISPGSAVHDLHGRIDSFSVASLRFAEISAEFRPHVPVVRWFGRVEWPVLIAGAPAGSSPSRRARP